MKLFKTASSDIVQECQSMFVVRPVPDQVLDRKRKCDNALPERSLTP